eukprot:COSAG06_NODE_3006_length_5969_cov_2.756218_4_plen_165_part_00
MKTISLPRQAPGNTLENVEGKALSAGALLGGSLREHQRRPPPALAHPEHGTKTPRGLLSGGTKRLGLAEWIAAVCERADGVGSRLRRICAPNRVGARRALAKAHVPGACANWACSLAEVSTLCLRRRQLKPRVLFHRTTTQTTRCMQLQRAWREALISTAALFT